MTVLSDCILTRFTFTKRKTFDCRRQNVMSKQNQMEQTNQLQPATEDLTVNEDQAATVKGGDDRLQTYLKFELKDSLVSGYEH
jgi:hypothetical protein